MTRIVSDDSPTALELLWFGVRHPLKAIALLFASTVGFAIFGQFEWSIDLVRVSCGDTAQPHQISEGIEIR